MELTAIQKTGREAGLFVFLWCPESEKKYRSAPLYAI